MVVNYLTLNSPTLVLIYELTYGILMQSLRTHNSLSSKCTMEYLDTAHQLPQAFLLSLKQIQSGVPLLKYLKCGWLSWRKMSEPESLQLMISFYYGCECDKCTCLQRMKLPASGSANVSVTASIPMSYYSLNLFCLYWDGWCRNCLQLYLEIGRVNKVAFMEREKFTYLQIVPNEFCFWLIFRMPLTKERVQPHHG